ncbi:MAG: hypothetical protein SFU98_16345 [Leptospiraceae bacterium]|nr:hypothetical protein [Leptospiraceae bacterium]
MEFLIELFGAVLQLDEETLDGFGKYLGTGFIGFILIYKKLDAIKSLLKSFVNNSQFNKFNSSIENINLKQTSYVFRNFITKENSQELFEVLKVIYDKETTVNVPSKKITFNLHEIHNEDFILRNVNRFLDYFKEKNGMLINFKIQEVEVKQELIKNIGNLKLTGKVKIL